MNICEGFSCVICENGKCLAGCECDPSKCDASCECCEWQEDCDREGKK